MRYAIVIERTGRNYAAYAPDLPGCMATGATLEETERRIRSAVVLHIEGLRAEGQAMPEPESKVEYVDVAS